MLLCPLWLGSYQVESNAAVDVSAEVVSGKNVENYTSALPEEGGEDDE